MLYICIPVHNEAPTIGVLLWKIRGALQDFARDYELVVYDDGSTDVTAEVLEPYTRVLPLTVLTGTQRRGYGAALDALARYVAAHTRYPRRDAMIVMQGDFTDRPEHIPELVKRFEGGADIVVTERQMRDADPTPVRRLHRLAPWILRPFLRVEGVPDPTSTYRLIRISVLRDALRDAGDRALVSESGTAANAELLAVLAPHYRRVESVPVEPRYDVRTRESRVRALADALALARFGWRNRKPGGAAARPLAAAPIRPTPEPAEPLPPRRRDEGERTVADAAVDGDSPRRRKRTRREERPETTTTGTPRERPLRERPTHRPRAAEPGEPTPELSTPADAVVESADAPAAPPRKRRKSRRRTRAEGEAATRTDETSTAAGAETVVETPASGESASAESANAESEGAPDGTTPARARRRRSRRKRTSSSGEAGAPTEASVSDGADEPAGAADAEPSAGGEEAGGEDGGGRTGRSRRSRRGRRRGGRGAAVESGEAGAPGAEPPAPTPTSADAP